MSIVLGIDPGGRTTGIVVVSRVDRPLDHRLVERQDGERVAEYAYGVASIVKVMVEAHAVELVAVEGLVTVNPHVRDRPISPTGLLQAAVVYGAVTAMLTHAMTPTVIVRPGSHGSNPLTSYPPDLVGARERKGTGKLRHVRSAFDVALAGRRIHRHPDLHEQGDML